MSFLGPATLIPLGDPLMSLVDTVCIGQVRKRGPCVVKRTQGGGLVEWMEPRTSQASALKEEAASEAAFAVQFMFGTTSGQLQCRPWWRGVVPGQARLPCTVVLHGVPGSCGLPGPREQLSGSHTLPPSLTCNEAPVAAEGR